MKKILHSLLLILFIVNIVCHDNYAQAPNYAGIKKIIADPQSDLYYPLLFKRYQDSDTTLTVREFRVLYYGYIFQDSYQWRGVSNYTDSVDAILDKQKLNVEDFNTIIKYEKLILEKSPFSLNDLSHLAFAYSKIGNIDQSRQVRFKYNMLFETILSTGDGIMEETAYHVISISHEYDILSGFGLAFGGNQSLTNKGCDYLTVLENDKNIKGLYFDVNVILNKEAKTIEKDLDVLWQFDGVQLYTQNEIKNIDPITYTSVTILKRELLDCDSTAIYSGLIQVTTKDTINTGAKYILKQTNNWILAHPLANYELNGQIINRDINLTKKFLALKPEQIISIEISQPPVNSGKCNNGLIRVTTTP